MAISGMTGFARVEGAEGPWSWAVEARSVNGRNLDTRFRGPAGFEALERVARETSQTRFARGQLTLTLSSRRAEPTQTVRINPELLARYVELASALVRDGAASPPSADGLLALRGVVETAEDEETPEARAAIEAAMAASIVAALDALLAARLAEGAALAPILTGLIDRIEGLVRIAETEAAAQTTAIRERFARRMAELGASGPELQERIVQEAAVLAVKADVREELDRLKSHIAAARELLRSEGGAGRRFDFLAQEFNREANTLCSKSATTALTATGLELKAAIEQLREQIQNVE
jgi:uncharacterized protein (TIGR00255 family)